MTVREERGVNAPSLPYRLAVFDLDGTLLDTLDDLADAVNYGLKTCGFPVRSREEIRKILGNGMRNLIRRSVPENAEAEWERVFRVFVPYYEAHCREKTGPYPGVPETLRALRSAGVKTAVISNKADPAVQLLIRDYFPDLFDYICRGETGNPPKAGAGRCGTLSGDAGRCEGGRRIYRRFRSGCSYCGECGGGRSDCHLGVPGRAGAKGCDPPGGWSKPVLHPADGGGTSSGAAAGKVSGNRCPEDDARTTMPRRQCPDDNARTTMPGRRKTMFFVVRAFCMGGCCRGGRFAKVNDESGREETGRILWENCLLIVGSAGACRCWLVLAGAKINYFRSSHPPAADSAEKRGRHNRKGCGSAKNFISAPCRLNTRF